MGIFMRSNERVYSPTAEAIAHVEGLVKSHGLVYTLTTYVNRHHWTDTIRKAFEHCSVENMTDYNYSRCFDYSVGFITEDLPTTSLRMRREYLLEKGEIYGLSLKISILGPYLFVRFYHSQMREGTFVQDWSLHPFLPEHDRYAIGVAQFCKSNQLKMLHEEALRHILPDVTLELTEEGASVFNFLFEDGASPMPY